jgi:hypothetical protein
MKLSKTAQWILAIGILAVLLVTTGVVYARQMVERSQLNSDIAQANQDFVTYSGVKTELQTRMSQAEAQLSTLQSEFYESTQSIEISQGLFETADDAHVSLTDVSCSLPKGQKVNGMACQVFSLSLTVKGANMAELLSFTTKLGKRFPDATIESPRISISEEESTLNLELKVYTL